MKPNKHYSQHVCFSLFLTLWLYSPLFHPCSGHTSQKLFDLSAGLRCCELVDDIQGSLAVGVPHCGINATLWKQQQHRSCVIISSVLGDLLFSYLLFTRFLTHLHLVIHIIQLLHTN